MSAGEVARIRYLYKKESPVTLENVSMVLRRLTGREVSSSNQSIIEEFARKNRIRGSTEFTLEQFENVCEELNVANAASVNQASPRGNSEPVVTIRSPSRSTSQTRKSLPTTSRPRNESETDDDSGRPQPLDIDDETVNYQEIFRKNEPVSLRNVFSVLREITGKPVLGSQRAMVTQYVKQQGLGTSSSMELDVFEGLMSELGIKTPSRGSTHRRRSAPRGKVDSRDRESDSSAATTSLREGQRVEARYRGGRKYFKGVVTRNRGDDTFDIEYDDGDQEKRVPIDMIKTDEGSVSSPSKIRSQKLSLEVGDSHGVGIIQQTYENAKSVTGNNVALVIRKITGKPVIGSQRTQITEFTKRHRIAGSSVFSLEQFEDLCRDLGISAAESEADSKGSSFDNGSKRLSNSPQRIQERFSSDTDTGESFQVGDVVEARFQGKSRYYKGRITRVHANGTFDIDYDDGERERRVEKSLIRLSNSRATESSATDSEAGPKFERGQEVEARFRGGSKYYKGTIMRVNVDGSYDIDYADGDRERGVDPSIIRSVGGGSKRSPSRGRENSRNSNQGDNLRDAFESERSVTGNNVALLIRKITGKPVIGSQRTTINEFTKRNRISGPSKFSFEQFDDLCRELGVTAGGESGAESRDSSVDARTNKSPTRRSGSPRKARDRFSDDSDDSRFAVGDPVEARFHGKSKYFKGRISRANADGSYDIDYADGDREMRVEKSMIKRIDGAKLNRSDENTTTDSEAYLRFERGQEVEARFRGGSKYYRGTIMRVNADGTYDIDFVDGDRERGVDVSKIREVSSPKKSSPHNRRDDDPSSAGGGIREMFEKEKSVTGNNVALLIRKITGKPVIGSQRMQITGFAKRHKISGPSKFTLEQFEDLCQELGVSVSQGDSGVDSRDSSFDEKPIRGSSAQRRGGDKFSDDSEEDNQDFRVGDSIEARFKGKSKYFKGRITKAHPDGSYDIDYEDGDRERFVAKSMIRSLGKSPSKSQSKSPSKKLRDFTSESESELKFDRGQQVEAKFRGGSKYYKGTIMRVNTDGTYDIDYADGDRERGVDPAKIRAVSGSPTRSRNRNDSRNGGGGQLHDIFEKENSVTGNNVSLLIRKITGKPVIGSQRMQIASFTKRHGIQGSSQFTWEQFEDLCKQLGVSAGEDSGAESRDSSFDDRPIKSPSRRSRSPKRNHESYSDDGQGDSGDFRVGDDVEARFKGKLKYFKGRITKAHSDGTFDIDYDDGDRERYVAKSMIRSFGRSSPKKSKGIISDSEAETKFERGQQVEAKFRGGSRFYQGTIMRVNTDGTYDIDYVDGDRERGVDTSKIRAVESVSTRKSSSSRDRDNRTIDSNSNIRDMFEKERSVTGNNVALLIRKITGKPVIGSQRTQITEFTRRNRISGLSKFSIELFEDLCKELGIEGSGDSSTDEVPRKNPNRRSSSPRHSKGRYSDESDKESESFQVGDEIEARFKGKTKYFKGRITKTHSDGTYDIDYADGDRERFVAKSMIRGTLNSKHKGDVSESEAESRFERGQEIEARFRGGSKYYKGTIMRANTDGTYDIDYADGDRERGVESAKIRAIGRSRSPKREAKPHSGSSGNGIREIFEKEKSVTGNNVALLIRKITGKPVIGSQRMQITGFTRRHRIDGSSKFTLEQFEDLCRDLGVSVTADSSAGSRDSSIEDERQRSPTRRSGSAQRAKGRFSDDSEEENFRIGDQVEARFKGKSKYFRGRIKKSHSDGTYDIDYEDGDRERFVARSMIRGVGGTTASKSKHHMITDSEAEAGFERGQQVEARFRGGAKYYKGTIMKVNSDGTYDIDYEDGDRERGVSASKIRQIQGSPRRTTSRERSEANRGGNSNIVRDVFNNERSVNGNNVSLIVRKVTGKPVIGSQRTQIAEFARRHRITGPAKFTLEQFEDLCRELGVSNDDESRADSSAEDARRKSPKRSSKSPRRSKERFSSDSDVSDSFRVGDTVEAKFKGMSKYFKGRITKAHSDGTYDIDYDDGDRERFVAKSMIRALKTSSKSRVPVSDSEAEARFERGQEVEARFKGGSRYYKGTITRDNRDGTYDIDYADGDREKGVETAKIRALDSRKSPKKSNMDDRRSPKKSRSGSSSRIREMFEKERSVTGNNVAIFIRKITGKPVIGTQRTQLASFTRKHRITGASAFTFEQFQELCEDLNIQDEDREQSEPQSSEENGDDIDVGSAVECQLQGERKARRGVVAKIHRDGRFDIEYENGEFEDRVHPRYVKSRVKHDRKSSKDRRSKSNERHSKSRKGRGNEDGDVWSKMKKIALRESPHHVMPTDDEIAQEKHDKKRIKMIVGERKFKELQRAFNKYDIDGNGQITEDEVIETFKSMGKKFKKSDIRDWMESIDINYSNGIDFVEFVKAYAGVELGSGSEASSGEDRGRRSPPRRSSRNRSRRGRRSRSSSDRSGGSSVSTVSQESLDAKASWRQEGWAARVDKDTMRLLDRQFLKHAVKSRKGKKRLPVKHLRVALQETGKTVSISQVGEYLSMMGFDKKDLLSISNFVHAYSYMFVDPERDEFGRAGSYYDKVWGHGSSLVPASYGDAETIAAISATIFRTGEWRGTKKENEVLLRKLSLGRETDQIAMLKTWIQEFENIEIEGTGEIQCSEMASLLRNAGVDVKPVMPIVEQISEHRTTISLPEFLAHFGFLVEKLDSSPTVAAAFAMLRLHCTPTELRGVGDAALRILNDIVTRPDDARLWSIRLADDTIKANIGKFKGGIELLMACGFQAPAASVEGGIQRLTLKGVADKHGRTMIRGVNGDTLATLKFRREEIERELRVIDGGVVSISEALRLMQNDCTLIELETALDTVSNMVTGILKNPKDSRLWRVRGSNSQFINKIGKFANGPKLMECIGFEYRVDTGIYVLRGTEPHAANKEFKFPTLSPETEEFLWRRKADLDVARRTVATAIASGEAAALPSSKSQILKPDTHSVTEPRIAQLPYRDMTSYEPNNPIASMQLKMIREAFAELDVDRDGYISATDLHAAFQKSGRKSTGADVSQWIKIRDVNSDGVVSFDEYLSSLAYLLPPQLGETRELRIPERGSQPKQSHTQEYFSPVASAFGLAKILNAAHVTKAMCESVLAITRKTIPSLAKKDAKLSCALSNDDIKQAFGPAVGVPELMSSVGWTFDAKKNSYSIAKKKKESIESRLVELRGHMLGLEEDTIADIRALTGAMRTLVGDSPSTNMNSLVAWRGAIHTTLKYLRNIQNEPRASKFRRVNCANDAFMNKIGKMEHGLQLFYAVGFQSEGDTDLVLPVHFPLQVLNCKILELEAAASEIDARVAIVEKKDEKKDEKKPKSSTNERSKTPARKGNAQDEPQQDDSQVNVVAMERIQANRIRELESQIKVLQTQMRSAASKRDPLFEPSPDTKPHGIKPQTTKSSSRSRTSVNVVSAAVASPVHRGALIVPLTSLQGFKTGDLVSIGNANHDQERRFIASFAEEGITVEDQLTYDHQAGEQVFVAKPTPGEVEQFKKREQVRFIKHEIVAEIVDIAMNMGIEKLEAERFQLDYINRPLEKSVFTHETVFNLEIPVSVSPSGGRNSIASLVDDGRLLIHGSKDAIFVVQESLKPKFLRLLFCSLDLDGDGVLCKREIYESAMLNPDAFAVLRSESLRVEFSDGNRSLAEHVHHMNDDARITWPQFVAFFNVGANLAFAVSKQDRWIAQVRSWRSNEWAANLSDEDVDELFVDFCMFDSDADGYLTAEDWIEICEYMDGEVYDPDDIGQLNFEGFCHRRCDIARRQHASRGLATLQKGISIIGILLSQIRRIFITLSVDSRAPLQKLLRLLPTDPHVMCMLALRLDGVTIERRIQRLVEYSDTIDCPQLIKAVVGEPHVVAAMIFDDQMPLKHDIEPSIDMLVDSKSGRVIFLHADGMIRVYNRLLSSVSHEARVSIPETSKHQFASKPLRVLAFDEFGAMLILDLTKWTHEVYIFDSTSLALLRVTKVRPKLSGGFGKIEPRVESCVYSSKLDVLILSMSGSPMPIQICDAKNGHVLAIAEFSQKSAQSCVYLEPERSMLLTGHGSTLRIWDLKWQLKSCLSKLVTSQLNDDDIISNIAIKLRKSVSDFTLSRPGKILALGSHNHITVRYVDEKGGIDYDIDTEQLAVGKQHPRVGEDVRVRIPDQFDVVVESVVKNSMDVTIVSNGLTLRGLPIQDGTEKGSRIRLVLPDGYFEKTWVADYFETNWDQTLTFETFQEHVMNRCKSWSSDDPLRKVFDELKPDEDDSVLLATLAAFVMSANDVKPTPFRMPILQPKATVHQDGREHEAAFIVGIDYVATSCLIVVAYSNNTIGIVDPLDASSSLCHPVAQHLAVKGCISERVKTNAAYKHVFSLSLDFRVKDIQVVKFSVPEILDDLGFIVEAKQVAKIEATERNFEVDAHSVRGFCYIFEDRSIKCIPCEAFEQAFVDVDDPLKFGELGGMSSLCGWQSGTDDLREIFTRRSAISKVIYFICGQVESVSQLESIMVQRRVSEMNFETMRRSFTSKPHVELFPFFKQGDGPDKQPQLAMDTDWNMLSQYHGTITRKISRKFVEVVFDFVNSIVRVPLTMIRLVHENNIIGVGSRVMVNPQAAPHKANIRHVVREHFASSPLEVVVVSGVSNSGRLQVRGVDIARIRLGVRAMNYDGEVTDEQYKAIRSVRKQFIQSRTRSWQMSLPRIRNQNQLQIRLDESLLQTIGNHLRAQSLDIHQKSLSFAKSAYEKCLLLPFRWSSRYYFMLDQVTRMFRSIATGEKVPIADVLREWQKRVHGGDAVFNYGLTLAAGKTFAALDSGNENVSISLEELKRKCISFHAMNLAKEELSEILQRIHFGSAASMERDVLQDSDPTIDTENFIRICSYKDPFWSLKDCYNGIYSNRFIEEDDNPRSTFDSLAMVLQSASWNSEIRVGGQYLDDIGKNLFMRAFELWNATFLEYAMLPKSQSFETARVPKINEVYPITPVVGRISCRLESARLDRDLSAPERRVFQYFEGDFVLDIHAIKESKLHKVQVGTEEPYEAHFEKELAICRMLSGEHYAPLEVDSVRVTGSMISSDERLVCFQRRQNWTSLRSALGMHGFMASPRRRLVLRFWARQLLDILTHLHGKGIVLRGPRTEHLLVSPCGSYLQLGTLATAAIYESNRLSCADFPEVAASTEFEPDQDDISIDYDTWCFGRFLLECLSGNLAVFGATMFDILDMSTVRQDSENAFLSIGANNKLVMNGVDRRDTLRTALVFVLDTGSFSSLLDKSHDLRNCVTQVNNTTFGSFEDVDVFLRTKNIKFSEEELHDLQEKFSRDSIPHLRRLILEMWTRQSDQGAFLLDILQACLQPTAAARPMLNDLRAMSCFEFTDFELVKVAENAQEFINSPASTLNIKESIQFPMEILATQSFGGSDRWPNGCCDARLLLDTLDHIVQGCCIQEIESDAIVCDEMMAIRIREMDVIQLVVVLVLRLYTSAPEHDDHFANDQSEFLPETPSRALVKKILERVVEAILSMVNQLTNKHSPLQRYVAGVVKAALCLYFAVDNILDGEGTSIPSYTSLGETYVCWSAEYEKIVSPVIINMVGDIGASHIRIPAIAAFFARCDRELDIQLDDMTSPLIKVGFMRTTKYALEILIAGRALAQLEIAKRRSKSRTISSRQLLDVVSSNTPDRIQLCVDMRLHNRISVFLFDEDTSIVDLTVQTAVAVFDRIPFNTLPSSQDTRLLYAKYYIASGFSNLCALTGTRQFLMSQNDTKKKLALRLLELQAHNEMTSGWASADILSALQILVVKKHDPDTIGSMKRVLDEANKELLSVLRALPGFITEIDPEMHLDMIRDRDDDADALINLLESIKQAYSIEEILDILIRVKQALNSFGLYFDANEDQLVVGDIMAFCWQQWFSQSWTCILENPQTLQDRLPLLKYIFTMTRSIHIKRGKDFAHISRIVRYALPLLIMEPEDLNSYEIPFVDLRSELLMYVGVEIIPVLGHDYPKQASSGVTWPMCLTKTMRCQNNLLRHCMQHDESDSLHQLIRTWPLHSQACRKSWNAILALDMDTTFVNQIVESGIIEYIIRDMLPDTNVLHIGRFGGPPDVQLEAFDNRMIIREDAMSLIRSLCRAPHPVLIAEMVEQLKLARSVEVERHKIWQTESERDRRNIYLLMRSLAAVRNESLEHSLTSHGQIPQSLCFSREMNPVEREHLWEQWAVRAAQLKSGNSLMLLDEQTSEFRDHYTASSASYHVESRQKTSTSREPVESSSNLVVQAQSQDPLEDDTDDIFNRLGDTVSEARTLFEKYAVSTPDVKEPYWGGKQLSKFRRENPGYVPTCEQLSANARASRSKRIFLMDFCRVFSKQDPQKTQSSRRQDACLAPTLFDEYGDATHKFISLRQCQNALASCSDNMVTPERVQSIAKFVMREHFNEEIPLDDFRFIVARWLFLTSPEDPEKWFAEFSKGGAYVQGIKNVIQFLELFSESGQVPAPATIRTWIKKELGKSLDTDEFARDELLRMVLWVAQEKSATTSSKQGKFATTANDSENHAVQAWDLSDVGPYRSQQKSNKANTPSKPWTFDDALRSLPQALRAKMDINTRRALWQAFCRYDVNRDGVIDFKELRSAFDALGRENVSDGELLGWMREHDASGEGSRVTFHDFALSYASQVPVAGGKKEELNLSKNLDKDDRSEAQDDTKILALISMFKHYDRNEDMMISPDDLAEKFPSMDMDEINEWIDDKDRRHQGNVCLEDFLKAYAEPEDMEKIEFIHECFDNYRKRDEDVVALKALPKVFDALSKPARGLSKTIDAWLIERNLQSEKSINFDEFLDLYHYVSTQDGTGGK